MLSWSEQYVCTHREPVPWLPGWKSQVSASDIPPRQDIGEKAVHKSWIIEAYSGDKRVARVAFLLIDAHVQPNLTLVPRMLNALGQRLDTSGLRFTGWWYAATTIFGSNVASIGLPTPIDPSAFHVSVL